jgi:hypothetical protein
MRWEVRTASYRDESSPWVIIHQGEDEDGEPISTMLHRWNCIFPSAPVFLFTPLIFARRLRPSALLVGGVILFLDKPVAELWEPEA